MTSLTRRSFLIQGASGLLGWSAMSNLVTTPAEASPVTQAIWTTVSWLGRNILAPAGVKLFVDWIKSTNFIPTEPDDTFHGQFSPGFGFDRPFDPVRTRYANYLGVRNFANLSQTSRLSRGGELNVAEIQELQNDANPNLWSGGILRLVPANSTERFEPTQLDVDRFATDLLRSGMNPYYMPPMRVQYARKFCDCNTGAPLRGIGWSAADGSVGFRILTV